MFRYILLLSTAIVIGVVGFPPVIIKQPVESEILFKIALSDYEHKPFKVECEAEGDPLPEYYWTKDGENFNVTTNSDHINLSTKNGTLTFLNPNEEDEGKYFCYAENKYGKAKSKAILLRRAHLENFKNESLFVRTINVTEGESLKLECEAPEGYPKPSIFWLIHSNQGSIRGIDDPRITVDTNGSLWFSSVSRDDTSKDSAYVCSAASFGVNEYKLGTRYILKVHPRPHKSFKAPTLLFESSPTLFALRGKTVEIFCVYDGTPLPKIAWSKDGNSIEHNERLFLENQGKSLKIKKADAGDKGNYTCEVSSENGEIQSSNFELEIESPPTFITQPKSIKVREHEAFEILCKVDGLPKPEIEWLFNGNPIGNMEKLLVNDDKLIIEKASETETGNYACIASNSRGNAYANIYVHVTVENSTLS